MKKKELKQQVQYLIEMLDGYSGAVKLLRIDNTALKSEIDKLKSEGCWNKQNKTQPITRVEPKEKRADQKWVNDNLQKPLQLEVGKWYEDRKGRSIRVKKEQILSYTIRFLCDDYIGLHYCKNGRVFSNGATSEYDLIKEVPNPNTEDTSEG